MRHRNLIKRFTAVGVLALLTIASAAFADAQQDADKSLANAEWREAAIAYEALLLDDDSNAGNWLSLGSALEQLQRFEKARRAYEKSIAAGYQPLPRARLDLARVLAELQEKELALEQLEEIAKSGGPGYQNRARYAGIRELSGRSAFRRGH